MIAFRNHLLSFLTVTGSISIASSEVTSLKSSEASDPKKVGPDSDPVDIAASSLPDNWPYGFHFRTNDPMIPEVGLKLLRINSGWAAVENGEGKYDWAEMDRYFNYAKEHGHKILRIHDHIPRWASSAPKGTPTYPTRKGNEWLHPYNAYAPKDFGQMSAFVEALVVRYKDFGVLYAIEVFHEPNVHVFPVQGAEGYLKTTEIIHGLIEKHVPDVKLVGYGEIGTETRRSIQKGGSCVFPRFSPCSNSACMEPARERWSRIFSAGRWNQWHPITRLP